jgi:hypothetical protein
LVIHMKNTPFHAAYLHALVDSNLDSKADN